MHSVVLSDVRFHGPFLMQSFKPLENKMVDGTTKCNHKRLGRPAGPGARAPLTSLRPAVHMCGRVILGYITTVVDPASLGPCSYIYSYMISTGPFAVFNITSSASDIRPSAPLRELDTEVLFPVRGHGNVVP